MKEISKYINNIDTMYFGNKRILLASEQDVKSAKSKILLLRDNRLFPNNSSLEDLGLIHEDISNKSIVFIESKVDGKTYYLGVRQLGFINGSLSENVIPNGNKSKKAIIAGGCMFGSLIEGQAQSDSYVLTHFNSLKKLLEHPSDLIDTVHSLAKLHSSEADYLLRMIPFINSVQKETNSTVFMHMPQVEYYFYALDLYLNGKMTKDAFKNWCNLVDQRTELLIKMTKKRLNSDFNIIKPLAQIISYIKEADDLSLNVVINFLKKDPLWEGLLEKKEPETFSDLGYLSYVYAYLKLAIENDLVIGIEDPSEERLFFNIKKYIKLIKDEDPLIMTYYVHPKFAVDEEDVIPGGRRILYYHDTRQDNEVEHIGMLRRIISANQ